VADIWWLLFQGKPSLVSALSNIPADVDQGHLVHLRDSARCIIYSDTPDTDADKYFKLTLPQSQDSFKTAVNFIPADMVVHKTYIICEKDQKVPAPLQRQMTEQIPGFKVQSLNSDHSPFISQADECAELIGKLVQAS
jgi:hypothetical protein